jgi:hypothetical protein
MRGEKEHDGKLPLFDGLFCAIGCAIDVPAQQMEYRPPDRIDVALRGISRCRRTRRRRSGVNHLLAGLERFTSSAKAVSARFVARESWANRYDT